jgi:hypothetical protein
VIGAVLAAGAEVGLVDCCAWVGAAAGVAAGAQLTSSIDRMMVKPRNITNLLINNLLFIFPFSLLYS